MRNNQAHPDKLFSSREFEVLLQRERARADRAGSEFSLIVFSVNGLQEANNQLHSFLRQMRSRIRSVDDLGWFHEHSVGLLLPLTGFKGASSFAEDIAKRFPKKAELFPYSIFSYPSQWYIKGKWGQIGNGRGQDDDGRMGVQQQAQSSALEQKIESVLVGKCPGWKRAMDVAGSVLGLMLASPLLLFLFVFVKAVSPGPALFRQLRVGYKSRLFTFFKLRTMHPGDDTSSHRNYSKNLIRSGLPMSKLDALNDPRIVPGGRILRRTCLDELPQLINVLRGEMSLVGPRPCLPYEAEEYQRWHAHRFDVKPGMTGLWQVSGKNNLTFQQMIRLDIAYCQSMSLWKDIKILLLTGPAIIGFVLEALGRRFESWRIQGQRKTDVDSTAVG